MRRLYLLTALAAVLLAWPAFPQVAGRPVNGPTTRANLVSPWQHGYAWLVTDCEAADACATGGGDFPKILIYNSNTPGWEIASGGAGGSVSHGSLSDLDVPAHHAWAVNKAANATDNALLRQVGTSGNQSEQTGCTVDDSDVLTCPGGFISGAGGYNLRTQWPVVEVFPNGETVVTGDQQACFLVPGVDDCDSNPIWCTAVTPLKLVAAGVMLGNTAGTSTGITVQISRKRLSDATTKGTVDTLSTLLTTDATEFSSADATTAAVINTANDDAAPGDDFCVDVDAVPTGAEGLRVWMKFAP